MLEPVTCTSFPDILVGFGCVPSIGEYNKYGSVEVPLPPTTNTFVLK